MCKYGCSKTLFLRFASKSRANDWPPSRSMTGLHLGSNFEGQGGPIIAPELLFQNVALVLFWGKQIHFPLWLLNFCCCFGACLGGFGGPVIDSVGGECGPAIEPTAYTNTHTHTHTHQMRTDRRGHLSTWPLNIY